MFLPGWHYLPGNGFLLLKFIHEVFRKYLGMPIARFSNREATYSGLTESLWGEKLASGIWPAVSGATAQARSIDIIANNVANTDTLGFKKDAPTFREYLSHAEAPQLPPEVPLRQIKDSDFYPLDGRDQSFVVVDGTYTDFKTGSLRVTDVPLDLAIDGPGFFEISTPSGTRYTKQGSFTLAMDGRLVTSDGFPVLAAQPKEQVSALAPNSTEEIAGRFINLRDFGKDVSITESGEIFSGERKVGKMALVEFKDNHLLRKSAGQLFENNYVENLMTEEPISRIRQGMLETSNVNPIEEMAKLIKANRSFEQTMKAVKTYDDLMGKEVNELPKF